MENNIDKAIQADIANDLKIAISLYEECLLEENSTLDVFLNLGIIYWDISFDYGASSNFIADGVFSEEEVAGFSSKYNETLNKAKLIYPDNVELEFWMKYIKELTNYSDHNSCGEFRKLVKRDPECLTPYFYLGVLCDDKSVAHQTQKLKAELLNTPTYKNKYLLSFL
jgi:hypothetical protein